MRSFGPVSEQFCCVGLLERSRLLVYASTAPYHFLDPRAPATAASQDSSPASAGSDSLEGRIAELERRLS